MKRFYWCNLLKLTSHSGLHKTKLGLQIRYLTSFPVAASFLILQMVIRKVPVTKIYNFLTSNTLYYKNIL